MDHGPTWLDNFIARPHRVQYLPYGDKRNSWYRKWERSIGKKNIRDAWPWRIRIELWWFHSEYTVGLLYWDTISHRDLIEPGFGVHFYITGKGWIETLAC